MPTLDTAVYGALLQEFNVARFRQVNRERAARIDALKTKADAEAYVAQVRERSPRSSTCRSVRRI